MKGAQDQDRKKLESEFDSFMAELGEADLHLPPCITTLSYRNRRSCPCSIEGACALTWPCCRLPSPVVAAVARHHRPPSARR